MTPLNTIGMTVLCFLLGVFLLVKPELAWKLEHFWTTQNGEPTDTYMAVLRLTGMGFILMGAALLAWGAWGTGVI